MKKTVYAKSSRRLKSWKKLFSYEVNNKSVKENPYVNVLRFQTRISYLNKGGSKLSLYEGSKRGIQIKTVYSDKQLKIYNSLVEVL